MEIITSVWLAIFTGVWRTGGQKSGYEASQVNGLLGDKGRHHTQVGNRLLSGRSRKRGREKLKPMRSLLLPGSWFPSGLRSRPLQCQPGTPPSGGPSLIPPVTAGLNNSRDLPFRLIPSRSEQRVLCWLTREALGQVFAPKAQDSGWGGGGRKGGAQPSHLVSRNPALIPFPSSGHGGVSVPLTPEHAALL